VAVIPKTLWRFANAGLTGVRHGASCSRQDAAMVLAAALNFVTPLILGGDWNAVSRRIYESYPWWCGVHHRLAHGFPYPGQEVGEYCPPSRRRLCDVLVMALGGGWRTWWDRP
jgi:hypothetical protein